MNVPEWAEEAIVFDGLESALIGFGLQFTLPVAIYDYDLIIENLMSEEMNEEDAIEYFEFNVQGLYAGPNTPVILRRDDEFEVE